MLLSFANSIAVNTEAIPYSKFLSLLDQGKIDNVTIGQRELTGKYKDQKKRFATVRVDDPQLANRLATQK